ncbi:trifunctional serine/threonine-protein kinase/ATP-binding protein/sensor histidine kinase [Rhizobium sp. GCM10022189]|uniref:trifunctional serine/threonine-protein kinase/ATP-binding protein/sensor histidine kinase n=1 Tax=Rhizobium sp. GCM10022189 TaxID=3252654 RepID=UPI0036149649
MMVEGAGESVSGYELRPVRESEQHVLYRGIERRSRRRVLAVSAPGGRDAEHALRREHSMADRLLEHWAVRPLEFVHYQGQEVLILEDPGGMPLDLLVSQRPGRLLRVREFLEIAANLAAILSLVHERGLIHKDIKPQNVFVCEDGSVRLSGFGSSTELPSQNISPTGSQSSGTLAYMSPEHTGRVNWPVDARSDLYSLGVTLYQILAGSLPFNTDDPLELLHCHIARAPASPSTLRPEIPDAVASVIMKLLAKSPYDRYQTASGVENDLRRCLAQWETQGKISPFPLAEHDLSARLTIPTKFYGRRREVDAFQAALRGFLQNGSSRLVLIGGEPGTGKTHLVREHLSGLDVQEILIATAKYEPHLRDSPLACMVPALQSLTRMVLSTGASESEEWAKRFRHALGANAALLTHVVPDLEIALGSTSVDVELPARESRRRIQAALRDFIRLFALPKRPLVLVLDDLQWADRASLDLVEQLLLTERAGGHVLVVGTCRSRDLADDHRLVRLPTTLRGEGVDVTEIEIPALTREDLGEMISDAMKCSPSEAQRLAKTIHAKTGGNALFATRLLYSLENEGVLRADGALGRWTWDEGGVNAREHSDNVVDMMVADLAKLPRPVLDVLRWLACFSMASSSRLLAEATEMAVEEMQGLLNRCARSGFIACFDDNYAFVHDKVRDAAYSMLPPEEKARRHERIGRILERARTLQDLDVGIFEVVDQFNRGFRTIETPADHLHIGRLNFEAGMASKAAGAYEDALTYLRRAEELLASGSGFAEPQMLFECDLALAQSEFVCGHTSDAERRLLDLHRRASDITSRAAVACQRIDLYVFMALPDRAVKLGIEFLAEAGLDVCLPPSRDDVATAYSRVWKLLEGRMVEDLVDLPMTSSADADATLAVLNRMILSALYENPTLHQLLIILIVQFSIEHGNNAASVLGYVLFGRQLITEFGDVVAGRRFGELSLALVGKGLSTFKARVYFNYGTGISSWSEHLSVGRSYIEAALETARRNGDLLYEAYCRSNLIGNAISSGESLPAVYQMATDSLNSIAFDFKIALAFVVGQLRLVGSMMRFGGYLDGLEEIGVDVEEVEQSLIRGDHPRTVQDIYWSRRLQGHVFLGEYELAIEAARKCETILVSPWPNIEGAEFHFYSAIAYAALLADASKEAPRFVDHRDRVREHADRLEAFAKKSPKNLMCRAALVEAEIARIEGRQIEADTLYEKAIRSAQANGFLQIEALACEVAARSYRGRGLEEIHDLYINRAKVAYRKWGANRILQRLGEYHSGDARASPLSQTLSLDTQLDVAAIVRASQAISREIRLPELIDRVMRLVIAHAGAEHGLLMLLKDNVPLPVAEARVVGGAIQVDTIEATVDGGLLPQTVLQYAIRTGRPVILEDACLDSVHSNDAYVRENRCRSILCMHIGGQGRYVGVLYLENNLTPGAFTKERLSVLDLLSSQAAISLENARLYRDLQRSETFLLQGQTVSNTGSFGWSEATREFFWSRELYQILEYEPDMKASPELVLTRVHPGDRPRVTKLLEQAIERGNDFDSDYRLQMPDGRVKHVQTIGRSVRNENLDFVGSIRDVTEKVANEEALREVTTNLAHVARVTTLNAMTASIAHEVNQPLSGIITNASTGMRFLSSDPPDLVGARETIKRTMRDANRASDVIARLRAMFQKQAPAIELVDLNELAKEVVSLTSSEILKAGASIATDYFDGLQLVRADRVQLQQVILNLLMNSAEALTGYDGPRNITIQTSVHVDGGVRLDVKDTGPGIDDQIIDRLFEPFFTTKANGLGVGLSICRSILASLGGQLWVDSRKGVGTSFSFHIPVLPQEASTSSGDER